MKWILYVIVLSVEIFLIATRSLYATEIGNISNWLLGINFTLTVFSVNFKFFGTQFSKYQLLKTSITIREWINILVLLLLPLSLPIIRLFSSDYFNYLSLWFLPIVLMSSIDNAWSTWDALNPKRHLITFFSEKNLLVYLDNLFSKMEKEVSSFNEVIQTLKQETMPFHSYSFRPSIIGLDENDIWDRLTELLYRSKENLDHTIYTATLLKIRDLVFLSSNFSKGGRDQYKERSGIQDIASVRLQSIIRAIYESDSGGLFSDINSSVLMRELDQEDVRKSPLDSYPKNISNSLFWLASKYLEDGREHLAVKIVNCFHAFVLESLNKIKSNPTDESRIDEHNIISYPHLIKALAQKAVTLGEGHYIYRCIEVLGFMGCSSAKIESVPTTLACLECLAQIGRESRAKGLVCFDHNCIIPFHSHAEENIGHIATWAFGKNSNSTIRGGVIQAISRLRGYQCDVQPTSGANPKIWIQETLDEQKEKIPHIESLSGMYGYGGKVDYSNLSDITEYDLKGFMGEVFKGPPMPISIADTTPDTT